MINFSYTFFYYKICNYLKSAQLLRKITCFKVYFIWLAWKFVYYSHNFIAMAQKTWESSVMAYLCKPRLLSTNVTQEWASNTAATETLWSVHWFAVDSATQFQSSSDGEPARIRVLGWVRDWKKVKNVTFKRNLLRIKNYYAFLFGKYYHT